MYGPLTNFIQGKRKAFDITDLLALSFVSIIVYIDFRRKKFYCTNLKRTEHEILSYSKPCKEKMRDMKKKTNLFLYKILNNSQNTTMFT